MKIYAPIIKEQTGGGWTFHRNFKKAMGRFVHFVDSWQEADIIFVSGVTMVPEHEIREAKKANKPIVFRVDNVPRKSRNRRSSPHERMRDFADMAWVVVYQSEWAKEYCYPLTGDGVVIYNGVDTSIFKPAEKKPTNNRYLFAYHGKNDVKQFWLAHYIYQKIHRVEPTSEFLFIYDFGRELDEIIASNYDFWNGEKYEHIPRIDNPNDMAELMRECTHLIYPAYADASPNVVLEARASGLEVVYPAPKELSGTQELLDPNLDISVERMAEEYFGLFQIVLSDFSPV